MQEIFEGTPNKYIHYILIARRIEYTVNLLFASQDVNYCTVYSTVYNILYCTLLQYTVQYAIYPITMAHQFIILTIQPMKL